MPSSPNRDCLVVETGADNHAAPRGARAQRQTNLVSGVHELCAAAKVHALFWQTDNTTLKAWQQKAGQARQHPKQQGSQRGWQHDEMTE